MSTAPTGVCGVVTPDQRGRAGPRPRAGRWLAPWRAWLLAALLPILPACGAHDAPVALQGSTMGTTWSVQLPGSRGVPRSLQADIEQLLAGLEAQLSHWRPDSAVSQFNRAAAGSWHGLPDDLAAVVAAALALAQDSGGAFDPALGALVNLWGFGPEGPRDQPPDAAALAAARMRSGWQRLRYQADGQRLFQPGGVELDLSGIAKGHAVDRVAGLLDGAGITDYLVEIGGELRARGRGPRGRPWRVAVAAADPGQPPLAVVELPAAPAGRAAPAWPAIATSGGYHAGFEYGGRTWIHLLDPRTGVPVPACVLSVTVLAASAMQADALATAFSVLGPVQGLAHADARGLAVMMLVEAPPDGDVAAGPGGGAEHGTCREAGLSAASAAATGQDAGNYRIVHSAAWPASSAPAGDRRAP